MALMSPVFRLQNLARNVLQPLNFLKEWYEDHYDDQFYSREELQELHHETGITHILTDRLGPLELKPIYQNSVFKVYDLKSLDRPEK